jgi:hypothetical protein
MIELAFLAIWNRLVNWGVGPIIATRTVAADGDVLRGLLSTAANHWRMARGVQRFVVARQPDDERCEVRIRLPLGTCLPAGLTVKPQTARVLTAELELGRRTVAWATWILVPGRGTTAVDLAVQLASRSIAARLVLLLGGRRWIARRLDLALATLATTAARVAEDVVALPASDDVLPPTAEATRHPSVAAGRATINR